MLSCYGIIALNQSIRIINTMKTFIRLLKFIPFILILLIISAGHRIFGGKENKKEGGIFDFGVDSANADVPGCATGVEACATLGAEGSSSGEGCDS